MDNNSKEKNKREMEEEFIPLEEYYVESDGLKAKIYVIERRKSFVKEYLINLPSFGSGTSALMKELKNSLIAEAVIKADSLIDPAFIESLKKHFKERAQKILSVELPKTPADEKNELIGALMQEMLGLGKLEMILADPNLEELVVNQSREPVWVYHKKHGWLKTNIFINSEEEIHNYGSIIARRVGKQITTLDPLLDAHLTSGDRVNATLFPISNNGNTLTIRRFRREPWTVTDLIKSNTVNSEMMALLWEAMEYELNIIFSGGTASGKTTMLGVCLPFIQPNHRVLSIEDTRELRPPEFLHFVPLTTREPNPEGKGGISMLDLLVNSLRMRPDRIIVGEIRRKREAEVMFEAMHTGHSVYSTIHANTSDETIRRLTNPPINIPLSMLDAVHLNVVMFRNRRLGARRVLQVSELLMEKHGTGEEVVRPNVLYRWRSSDDKISRHNESIRLFDELSLHTGLNKNEVMEEIEKKKSVLDWMVKFDINKVNSVGKIVAQYYKYPEYILDAVRKKIPLEV